MAFSGKTYKKELDYSYTYGASPTMELLQACPGQVLHIYTAKSFTESSSFSQLELLTKKLGVSLEVNDRIINKLSTKENVYVIGAFKKYNMTLEPDKPHIVLVNPSDMGNVGTIIRTAIGFGIKNLAFIKPCVDFFHPRAVRSSMGAVFKVNCVYYDSFQDYENQFLHHDMFPFMTSASLTLQEYQYKGNLYSLIFGNEATGLNDSYLLHGKALRISHSKEIDSLNLSNAVSIAIYAFTNQK